MAYSVKVAIVGESNVGKTWLAKYFMKVKKPEDTRTTISLDVLTKTVERDVNGVKEQVQVQLWDTAGHERFRTIAPSFYRSAQVVIVCYDITDRKSYESVDYWFDKVQTNAASNVVLCLAGNKLDLAEANPEKRSVRKAEAEELVKKYSVRYFFETAALTGENVKDMFFEIVDVALVRLRQEDNEARDTFELTSSNEAINKGCRCCRHNAVLHEGIVGPACPIDEPCRLIAV